MPSWFFNRDEIVNVLSNEGYALIYQGTIEQAYNLENFAETYRLDRGRNSVLLFSR